VADAQISARAAQAVGLPEGIKFTGPFPFGGMNAKASPIAIPDNEFTWLENFVKLGDGNLRALWDRGASIYTAPSNQSIVYFAFYSLASEFYCAVFMSDGSAFQIKMSNRARTTIGPAGAFYSALTGYLPYARQWGSTYLLICNRNTPNDYWVWDGSLLYQAGSAGPLGVNLLATGLSYNSPPAVTAFGGTGSGMTFTPTVDNGGVIQVKITNPGTGYGPGDVVQLQFSGGGSDSSPVLEAQLSAGGVGGVSVTALGHSYSAATIVFSGGGGTGAAGNVVLTSGAVTGVVITNPGTGYTSAPSAVIVSGSGSGATVQPVLAPSGVASVTVLSGGTGFTSVPLITFVGGGGSGATGIAQLAPTTIAAVNLTAGGSGYATPPTVALTGGGGSGFAATANLDGDRVASVTITDAGVGYTSPAQITFTGGGGSGAGAKVVYTPTSIAAVIVSSAGAYYTTAPAVQVTPGANNSAYATVTLMPFGISGSAMETFLSRVWIINPADSPFSQTPPGNLYSFSAAGSVVDFSTSGGGGNAINTDAFLQRTYVSVRQSSGYLYFFGDGSISVVSNVNSSGTPTVTTYNYQNVDPQSGLSWRDSIQDFGRALVIANETGIYGLYGGSVTNISANIAQLFNNAVWPSRGGVTPSSATATIFNTKHYLNLMTLLDPDTGASRRVMATWNEKDWSISSQTASLTFVGTQKVESVYNAWGTDGMHLFPLFTTPSTALAKRFDTKQYGADRPYMQKQFLATYMLAQDHSAASVGVSGTFTLVDSGIGVQSRVAPSLQSGVYDCFTSQPAFQSPEPFWSLWGTGMQGIFFIAAGVRFTSTAPDFTLGQLTLGYKDAIAYYGQ
jgi:hypothetical protein